MIWINNSTTIIKIPRHSSLSGIGCKIKLINNITKKEYILDTHYTDSDSIFMYEFQVDLPDMDDGEYIYELYDEEDGSLTVIESGLLIYGDYQRGEVSEFQPESNTIVQYNG